MVRSSSFGSHTYNLPRFHTWFPYGSSVYPDYPCCTHELVGSFFNRHAVEVLPPLRLFVNIRFQIYFTPLAGVLFTFPSRYLSSIGFVVYVALGVSPPRFLQAIRVLEYSRTDTREINMFRIRDFHPLWWCIPTPFTTYQFCNSPE